MKILLFAGLMLAMNMALSPECCGQVADSLTADADADAYADADAVRSVPAADGGLGSTLTMEAIKQPQAERIARENKMLNVRPAAETVPALKYRLWQPDDTLQVGSAQLHFFRAMILWTQLPQDFRNKIENWTDDEMPQPSPQELKEAMDSLHQVFDELHLLATSEDMTWDHRLRDLRGPAMFAYLLPDVQQSRSLARLLTLRIRQQIAEQDVDGAIESLRDGFRLAKFVGQGETLVQQLVGIAIGSVMLNQVEQVMQMPGAPNLYWPLATLPRPLIDINRSIQFELNGIHRVIPLLSEAENEERSNEYWMDQWSRLLTDFEDLGGDMTSSRMALAIIGVASVGPAKERLIESGMERAKVEAMPPIQAVLIDASRSIRRASDDLAKANYLPGALGNELASKAVEDFQEWIQANQLKSGAAVIMGLLFPAVEAARSAGVRQEYFLNRLMTIEALRMHAATHNGALPKKLADLDPLPALPNPFNGDEFEYQFVKEGDAQVVTLKAEVPRAVEYFKEIQFRISK